MVKMANGSWVMVADGEKAIFLKNVTDAENPNLEVIRKEQQDNPPDREQGTHSPGRKADNGVGQRSAMDDTDWHELAKERFADEMAELLYSLAHRGKFDEIVLVAPPKTLGELRKKLHKEVEAKVTGEVPKNLTNHPVNEIESLLKSEEV